MKRLKYLALAAALALGACQVSPSSDAGTALRAGLTAYADVYQPAVLAYGKLPVCPAATLCRVPEVHAKLKAADLAASTTIEAARPVLNGSAPDLGQVNTALGAITNLRTQLLSSGALTGGQ